MTDRFNDPIDDIFGAPLRTEPVTPPANYRDPVTTGAYTEPCQSCRGRGRFISYAGRDCGACFECKGAGKQTFKTSAEDRTKSRVQAAARKAKAMATAWETFAAAQPEVAAWIKVSAESFPFAAAMQETVIKYGDLTENQLAACKRCIAARQGSREAAQARAAGAPEISVGKIEDAFTAARSNGIKRPKLNLGAFRFSMAPASGKNAGSIYVKQGEDYLGRVTEGKFYATRECGDDRRANIVNVASDPAAAAKAFGQRTGQCSCCGRELTNGISIDLGIGPICAEKYGW